MTFVGKTVFRDHAQKDKYIQRASKSNNIVDEFACRIKTATKTSAAPIGICYLN